jgi:two-component system KDP operon response regulator KdpE
VTSASGRILVVDDEPGVRDALSDILIRRGYQVRTAANGMAALEAVAAERPDVVLLDLLMPGLDGVEVSRRLRAASHLEIVILSAVLDEPEKVRALDAGADDYITKPFSVEELLARIRSALRRAETRRADAVVIQAGGIVIDQVARRVWAAGQSVHFTTTEYELLRVLVANPDRVLTHHFLLTTALGAAYSDAVEYLRTLVKQLRLKTEADPRRPQRIITEPGIGYRLRTSPTDDCASRRSSANLT